MRASRPFATSIALGLLVACAGPDGEPLGLDLVVRDVRLPVAGADYRGSSPHLFGGGAASLTCSSHGGFTSAAQPPRQLGAAVTSEYTATFEGELVLQPPLVRNASTHALQVQARMGERITLRTMGATQWVFDTELVTFELTDGMPTDVMVRQSPAVRSTGVTTIAATSEGRSIVETSYDVWLEISVDGGQSWVPSDGSVRMTLQSS